MLRKRILTLLAVIAVVCFICPVATAFANSTTSEKTLVAGTDISLSGNAEDLKIEDFTLGTNVTNGVTGSQDGLRKSFCTVLRGQSIIVKFAQVVNVNEYPTLTLNLSKIIAQNAVFSLYKNASGETIAKDTFTIDTGSGIKELAISLSKYADESGNVSSFVIRHDSDALATENEYFQIIIYESKLTSESNEEKVPTEDKDLIVGSDFVLSGNTEDLQLSNKMLGVNITNGVTGSVDGLKKSFGTVLRGQVLVVKFSQPVNISHYETIELTIGKNIDKDAVFAFYKNASGETTAKDSFVIDTRVAGKNITLNLVRYADDEGYVSSFVVEHVSDLLEPENESFQILLYNSTLKIPEEIMDYQLTINGVDMINGVETVEGTDKKDFYLSAPTSKAYCNEFTMNSIAVLKFGKPINTANYKTLSLNAKISNLTLAHTFYIELYKTSITDIETAIPSGRIAIKSNGQTATFEIDLTQFADEDGIVDGIIFYHLSNTRSEDYSNTSFWVLPSSVLTKEATVSEFNFPSTINIAEYINNFDGNGTNKLILEFNRYPFTTTEKEITNTNAVNTLADSIAVNGTRLSDLGDMVKYVVGYQGNAKRLAVLFNTEIAKDENNFITVKKDAIIKVGSVGYTLDKDYKYIISYIQDNVLIPARLEGIVKDVRVNYGDTLVSVNVKFNREIGSVESQGVTVAEKIFVNNVCLSTLNGVTITAHDIDKDTIVITIDNTSNVFKNDGTDSIKIENGFKTEKISCVEDFTYYQYDVEDAGWFKATQDTLTITGLEEYKSQSVLVKFSLKTSLNIGEDKVDISASSALKKIKFNGVSLYEIAKNGELSIVISGDKIDFIVERGVSGIKQNADDRIVIEQGFTLPTGGKTATTKYYKYSVADQKFVEFDGVELDPEDNTQNQEPVQGGNNGGCAGNVVGEELVVLIPIALFICAYIVIKKKKA